MFLRMSLTSTSPLSSKKSSLNSIVKRLYLNVNNEQNDMHLNGNDEDNQNNSDVNSDEKNLNVGKSKSTVCFLYFISSLTQCYFIVSQFG